MMDISALTMGGLREFCESIIFHYKAMQGWNVLSLVKKNDAVPPQEKTSTFNLQTSTLDPVLYTFPLT